MEAHLGSLLVLATCITAFSNECTFKFEEERLNNSHYVCRDDNGKICIRNTKWMTDNCERCTCEPGGIKCCKTVHIPEYYDKVKCQATFHKEKCVYTVVERNNPEKHCPVHAWSM